MSDLTPAKNEIATGMATKEDLSVILAAEKRRIENDLIYLGANVLGYVDMIAPFHKEVADLLQDQTKLKKLFLLPRKHLKTTEITITGSIQKILKNPDVRILIVNAVWENARRMLSEIKTQVEKNDVLVDIYGYFPGDRWTNDYITIRQRKKIVKEATITTAGLEKTETSGHYDIIILDDLVTPENITSRDQIDKVIDAYKYYLDLIEEDGEIWVLGTRYDFADLYGWLLKFHKESFQDAIMVRKALERGLPIFPQKFTAEGLLQKRKDQGEAHFSCNPGYAPVLMTDFTERQIKDIKVGDEVIGWDQGFWQRRAGFKKRKLVKSRVMAIGSRQAKIVKVTTKAGRMIYCTPDHNWYMGSQGRHSGEGNGKNEFRPARIGGKLCFVWRYEQSNIDNKWLAGIFDGEGSCSGKNVITIAQSKTHNPEVCKAIDDALKQNKFKFGYNEKNGVYWINGGFAEKARFLTQVNPIRKNTIISTLLGQKDFIKDRDEIISIEDAGEEEVYSMQTETGNYIIWGYCSKNCQYFNEPIAEEDQLFKPEDLRYYTDAEMDELLPKLDLYLAVDPAISTEKGACYTSYVIVGKDFRNLWYVIEAWQVRQKPNETIDDIFKYVVAFPNLKKVGVEEVAYQEALRHFIRDEMNRRELYFNIEPLRPKLRTKGERIRGLQPRFRNHSIFISPKHIELEYQLLHYPKAEFCDIIDALAYQLDLMPSSGAEKVIEDDRISPGKLLAKLQAGRRQNQLGVDCVR